ncbi:MAG: hypothetical protein AB7C95_07495, partial [Synergistaceae bacterium]
PGGERVFEQDLDGQSVLRNETLQKGIEKPGGMSAEPGSGEDERRVCAMKRKCHGLEKKLLTNGPVERS